MCVKRNRTGPDAFVRARQKKTAPEYGAPQNTRASANEAHSANNNIENVRASYLRSHAGECLGIDDADLLAVRLDQSVPAKT